MRSPSQGRSSVTTCVAQRPSKRAQAIRQPHGEAEESVSGLWQKPRIEIGFCHAGIADAQRLRFQADITGLGLLASRRRP